MENSKSNLTNKQKEGWLLLCVEELKAGEDTLYLLIDFPSKFILSSEMTGKKITDKQVRQMIEDGKEQQGSLPRSFFAQKGDPAASILSDFAKKNGLNFELLSAEVVVQLSGNIIKKFLEILSASEDFDDEDEDEDFDDEDEDFDDDDFDDEDEDEDFDDEDEDFDDEDEDEDIDDEDEAKHQDYMRLKKCH